MKDQSDPTVSDLILEEILGKGINHLLIFFKNLSLAA